MQIMIDLNDALESSRRAETAITVLRQVADIIEQSSIVQSSRKPIDYGDMKDARPEKDPEPAILPHGGSSRGMDSTTPFTGTITYPAAEPVAPPPPVEPIAYGVTATTAATATPIPADADPDVDMDDGDDAPAELSTSVQLPIAPPPPVAAVPAAVPAAPGPAVAPELDKRGYPWDGRIHAANRAVKLDGSWKNKRGVDPNLVVQIEALTRPLVPTPSAAASPVSSSSTAASVPTVAASAPVAPVPPSPTVGTVAPAAAAPSAIDFRGLMAKIATNTTAGKLTTDQVNAALAEVGLRPEEMGALVGNGPLIATINAAVDRVLSA